MPSIAICLACFNRREKTLRCLESLKKLHAPPSVRLQTYLVDDASPDGTGQAVRDQFPDVRLIEGNGNLFWGGGMHLAFGTAMQEGHDFYLWLNDDEDLFPDLIPRLLDTYQTVSDHGKRPAIIVGSSCDPDNGQPTYGGRFRPHFSPVNFQYIPPHPTEPRECETMNGNIVLIPADVSKAVGNIDPRFRQQMGDFDYGLRARRLGIDVWLCPGFVGTCAPNTVKNRWKSRATSLRQRLKIVNTPLGLPFRDWLTFAARHGGVFGLLFGLAAYRRVFFPDERASSTNPTPAKK